MRRLLLYFILLAGPGMAVAESTPFTIERSEVIKITSKDNVREYQLFVKTPRSYKSEKNKKYPLVFVNDGPSSFPLVSSITRQMSSGRVIEEPIIVGISYDKKTTWRISRTRDYTPTKSLNEKNRHSDQAREYSGRANEYLLFIETEVMPFLSREYRIDPDKKVYIGHSLGGLFGGYVLKTNPDLFDYYIMSDPSFWYHNGSIFRVQSQTSSKQLSVFISSQRAPAVNDCTLCMAKNAKKFSDELKSSLPDASIEYRVMENEIHETIQAPTISQGLLHFFRK